MGLAGHLEGRQKWFVPAVLALLVILALEMFLSARLESQIFDEPAHLYAGYSYWLHSDFGINPEHPPLVKLVASLPLLISRPKCPPPANAYFRAASAIGGRGMMSEPGAQPTLAHARIAVSVFVFLLALLVFFATREMFGNGASLLALVLFVFDPMIVANGPLIGTDIGVTCCLFAAVYALYRYVKQPSLLRLSLCALAAGLSLAAKHSAIPLFPILLLLCAAEVMLNRPAINAGAGSKPSRAGMALRLSAASVAIALVAVTVLWAFYGFRYAARRDGNQIVPPTAVYLKGLHPPLEASTIAFAEQHHLLPESYLYGLTDVLTLSNDGRPMYLFGRMYAAGRWFYFPAAFLIKSTLGLLLLLALLPFARALRRDEIRREVVFLILPPVVYFGIAMTSKMDMGIRHVLPIMPFLVVLAAAGAMALSRQSRGWAWTVGALVAMHVGSSLWAFPNYLPYSNEIFGGPNQTYRVLSGANTGWGGGLKALHASLETRQITKCWFAYSAVADPATFQIPCKRLPTFFSMVTREPQQGIPEQIEGPVFVSSEEIAGSYWGSDAMNPYRTFAKLRPSRVIAGEILEYDGNYAVRPIAAVSEFIVAETLVRQGKTAEAVSHAEEAVTLDPESLDAHETLSKAYTANHQEDAAMREYRRAEHLFEAVPPEFQAAAHPPVKPEGQK
ncbi:MAG TPA: glycosyltransferase family 39 protein [Edaphobacter sp.]|jgi:4-amino-4-deoxy-L-arabinose transferase-like glycosyltransferase|nr:glycosyltransferase family 39 protein [Edaphobacter sp.]